MKILNISDILAHSYSITVDSIDIDEDNGYINYKKHNEIGRIYISKIISFNYRDDGK